MGVCMSTQENIIKIGDRIKALLDGRTQAWLVDASDLDKALISRIINGKEPLPKHLRAIAKAFDITAQELVEGTDARKLLDPENEAQRQVLTEGIEELTAAYIALDARVQEQEVDLTRVSAELETARRLLGEAQQREDEARKIRADLDRDLRQARTRVKGLEADLASEQAARLAAARRVLELTGENRKYAIENSGLVAQVEGLEAYSQELSQEIGELRTSRVWTGIVSTLVGAGAGVIINENKDKL